MTNYFLSPAQIVQAFKEKPLVSTTSDECMQWFKSLVPNITKVTCLNVPIHDRAKAGAYRASTLDFPCIVEDVTSFTAMQLYPSIIKSWSDAFTIDNFHGFMDSIVKARALAKEQLDQKTQSDIKQFVNIIFGQLNSGKIRHMQNTAVTVVNTSKIIGGEISKLPCWIHSNIDEYTFKGLSNEEVDWTLEQIKNIFKKHNIDIDIETDWYRQIEFENIYKLIRSS